MKPLVTIIIVNFNGSSVLGDCFDSLKKLTYKNWELIVVDNGSQKNEITALKSLISGKLSKQKVKTILLSTNIGFAGGNNKALPEAHGKYILLLNNDTTVSSDLLTKMVKKMETDPTIGAMQPKIKLMDTPQYLDNAGAFLNPLGLTEHWGFGEKDSSEFDKEREIFSAKGACLMTRHTLVQEVGLFDDNFGSYFEESDFCYRVWLAGFRVLYFPDTFIFHKVGFTSKQMNQIEIMLKSTRNRIFSLFKNLSLAHLITILLPHVLFLFILMLYYIVRMQHKKAKMIFGAIWWNVTHFQLLLEERDKTQKLRKLPDSAFFSTIMKPLNFKKLFVHFKKVEANLNKL